MNKLPARTGWAWLKQGAALFGKQPAGLTMLLFANILISIAFSAVPFLGPILAVILIPSLSMAFMKACLLIDNGQRVTPGVLLTGFRKPAVGTLCKLGLVYLAVMLLLTVLSRLILNDAFWQQITGQQTDPTKLVLDASDVLGLFFLFLLDLAVLISLAFAAPLTYWEHMGAGKATFYSFFAVVKSARVFGVLLLAWFGMFFTVCAAVALVVGPVHIAQVIMMWLIFLFVLMLQCAIYIGYRQIFGKPVEPVSRQPA